MGKNSKNWLIPLSAMNRNGSNATLSFEKVSILAEDIPVFHLIPIQRINRIVCSICGILINGYLIGAIVRSRRLWTPRNIFWLGVTLFDVIAIWQSTVELVIYYLYRKSSEDYYLPLCQVYSTLAGCPYGLLLTNLTLATFERYLWLAHRDFYQRHLAVWILVISNMFILGAHLSPYWTGFYTVECTVRYEWLTAVLTFHGLISSVNIGVQTRLFLFIRACIRYASPVQNIELPTTGQLDAEDGQIPDEEDGRNYRRRHLNQLEMEAAQNFIVGIFPLFLVSLILGVVSLTRVVLQSNGSDSTELNIVMLVCRELNIFHWIYIWAISKWQRKDFDAEATDEVANNNVSSPRTPTYEPE